MTVPEEPFADVGIATPEALHDRFAGPLFLYALRQLGDRREAEEVVQDTMVRAWAHAGRFDPSRGSLGAWLFTIARNLTTDRRRRAAARPAGAALVDDPVEIRSVGEIDEVLEAWQVAEAVTRLSPEHRRAILDIYYLGYPVRETAARLGVPPGTVKSRLYYGLRALRVHLEELGVVR